MKYITVFYFNIFYKVINSIIMIISVENSCAA